MTSYWLLSMALCLIGPGLGDSPLVILSLCSLALSCVISIFSFLYLYSLSFPFVFFSLPYVFLHKVVFLNIYLYYLSKKKKNEASIQQLLCINWHCWKEWNYHFYLGASGKRIWIIWMLVFLRCSHHSSMNYRLLKLKAIINYQQKANLNPKLVIRISS